LKITFHAHRNQSILDMFVEAIGDEYDHTTFPHGTDPNRLSKIRMTSRSLIGKRHVEGPVSLGAAGKDPWRLHLHLFECAEKPKAIQTEYTQIRQRMLRTKTNIDEVDSPKKIPGLVRILRRISDRRLLNPNAPDDYL
jgi:hypothetical protein